tara:strand:- start:20365 stop:20805 length:441 start_codon:yes stop_codon:yes gene_type:complete
MNFECINNKFTNHKISNSIISKILNLLIKNEQKKINSLTVIIEDDEFLKELKKKYFNQDIYTDVITFNLEDKNDPIDGEIYISLPRVIDNSKIYNSDLSQEFKRVMIHGILHLFGYEDITLNQKKEMTSLEDKYINLVQESLIKSL